MKGYDFMKNFTVENPCQKYLLTENGRKAEITIQPFDNDDGLKMTIIIHDTPGLKVVLPITVKIILKDDIILRMDQSRNVINDDIFEILGFKYGPGIK